MRSGSIRRGGPRVRERVQGVLAVVVALVAVAGVVAGCAAAGATPRPAGSDAAQPPTVTTTAVPGRTDVDPGGEISVTAPDAALRDVALTGADGRAVAGTVTPDGHRWAATEALGYGKPYTWSGVAVGADGATHAGRRRLHHGEPGAASCARSSRSPTTPPSAWPRPSPSSSTARSPTRRPPSGPCRCARRCPPRAPGRGCPTTRWARGCTGGRRSTGRPARSSTSRRTCTGWTWAAAPTDARTSPTTSPSGARRSCGPTSRATGWS